MLLVLEKKVRINIQKGKESEIKLHSFVMLVRRPEYQIYKYNQLLM